MSSTSIRVTITRPNTAVAWPFEIFKDDTNTSADDYLAHVTNNQSFISGFEGIECIVDHHFPDSADLVTYHDELYASIPWWNNSTNAAEVATYIAANNITVAISEVVDPDHTGYMDITNLGKM